MCLMFICVLGCYVASTDLLFEGTDSIGGVTNSGRVWRKVPESDAQSVILSLSLYFLDH